MKNSFKAKILAWTLLLVLPLLVISLVSTGLVKQHTRSQVETALADLRSVQSHSINLTVASLVSAANRVAADQSLLTLMNKNSQYRLRTLNSPLLISPVPGIASINLSSERPLQDFVELINQQRQAAASGVVAMQLLSTDARILGESSQFSWKPDTPTATFDAMKAPGTTVGTVFNVSGKQHIPLITPVRGQRGELLGALVTEFDLAPLVRLINDQQEAAIGTRSRLVHRVNGVVSVLAPANTDLPPADIALASMGVNTGSIESSNSTDGLEHYTHAFISIPKTSWGLVVSGNTTAQVRLNEKLLSMTVVALVITLLLLAAGWLLLLRPLSLQGKDTQSKNKQRKDKPCKNSVDDSDKTSKPSFAKKISDLTADKAALVLRRGKEITKSVNTKDSMSAGVEPPRRDISEQDESGSTNKEATITESLEMYSNNPALLPVTIIQVRLRGHQDAKENLGAAPANEILEATAQRLQTAIGQHTIARHEDSQFVILASNTDQTGGARLLVAIKSAFTTTFETSAGEMLIGCDTGFAIADSINSLQETLSDAEAQINKAEQSTCDSNSSGKECVKMVERAIKQKRLETWYQPIIKIRPCSIPELIGAEAFMRLYNEQGKLIPPNLFMQDIQDHPMGLLLEQLVLKQALDALHAWHQSDQLPEGFQLSINASRHTVRSTKIVKFLRSQLATLQLSPTSIALEISGGTQQINLDVLADLQDLGVTLTMDDVGLKYDNIEQLLSIKPSYIKIDQRRLQDGDDGTHETAVPSDLNKQLQHMGVEIIAKSVESAEQIENLVTRGITRFQGYLFDQPHDADTFIEKWGVKVEADSTADALRRAG